MLYTTAKNATDELLSIISNLQQTDSGNSSECSSTSSCHSKLESPRQPDTASPNGAPTTTNPTTTTNGSGLDQRLLRDPRLLANLLRLEEHYRVHANHLEHAQPEVKPWMRHTLATWMLDVCRSQAAATRDDHVFPLAMNLLDRFLSLQPIGKRHLQLLGTVCMFIAAKLRSAVQFSAQTLVIYTANSISIEELLNWERFVLHKLKWDTCAVTPHDFLPHLLALLDNADNDAAVRETVARFIALACTDMRFCAVPASMVAGACLVAALKARGRLSGAGAQAQILEGVRACTGIDVECLGEVERQVEEVVAASMAVRFEFVGEAQSDCSGVEIRTF